MSSSVNGIPADRVHMAWPEAREYLLPAIERTGGRLDESSVLSALLKREMQLWMAERGAMVTEVITYRTRLKAAQIVLVGGKMDKWLHLLPVIESWAQSLGCDVIETDGRKGWSRILDWAETTVHLERRL